MAVAMQFKTEGTGELAPSSGMTSRLESSIAFIYIKINIRVCKKGSGSDEEAPFPVYVILLVSFSVSQTVCWEHLQIAETTVWSRETTL